MKRTYTNRRYLDALEQRVLIYNGAMGTSLQEQKLTAEHFGGEASNGCNDYLLISYPQAVEKVHRSFLEVGVDVIETDTFRANRLTLEEYGLGERVNEINQRAAELARALADEYSTPEQPRFVAGSIGPSGKLPSAPDPELSDIAYGRTAEIYDWQNGQVLKLFYDWFGLEAIKYERRIAQAVHASGLPVPAVGEIIQLNERNGLTYQRVEGVAMWEVMPRRPWNIFRYARQMAELHAEMHNSTIQVDIPNQRQKLADKINAAEALPANLRSKSLVELESLPEGNRLCHGDLHPGNIMVTGQDVIIIDWIDASVGNPLADLARTTILLRGVVEITQIPNPWHKIVIRILHATYVRYYFSIRPGGEREYARWLSIYAARLSENIPELEIWLIEQVEKG